MPQYQFITQSRNGSQIADITGLQDVRMLFQLNQPCMITASLRVNDPRARRDTLGGLTPGVHELKVYRDGEPLETVFQLAKVDVTGSYDTMRLNLEWHGIASYLQDALVYPQTAAYSSTTLPWTWINTFQTRTGGDYGITQGTVTGTPPTRQRSIQQDTGLFEAINDLAGSGAGFDWVIDTNRAYKEWHSQRGTDNGIVLEPGVNVTEWSYTEDVGPGQVLSDIRVSGPPGTQQVSASDTTTRTLYGRREASISMFADFEAASVTTGHLQSTADMAIARNITPVIVPQIRLRAGHQSIPWGSYWLGDPITFRADVGAYDAINAPYRIVQVDVALDANFNEQISVGVNAL